MAGWNDPTEIVLGGTGQVYVGAVGATAPTTDSSSLSASAWHGLGYTTEDGVSAAQSPEIQRFGAWQTKQDIRRERGKESFSVSGVLLQWNEDTLPFVFGGGSITDLGGGQYKFTPPTSSSALAEKSLVVDVVDGSNRVRIYIPRGTVVDGTDTQFNRSGLSTLSFSFEAMEPDDGTPAYTVFSNIAGLATGS